MCMSSTFAAGTILQGKTTRLEGQGSGYVCKLAPREYLFVLRENVSESSVGSQTQFTPVRPWQRACAKRCGADAWAPLLEEVNAEDMLTNADLHLSILVSQRVYLRKCSCNGICMCTRKQSANRLHAGIILCYYVMGPHQRTQNRFTKMYQKPIYSKTKIHLTSYCLKSPVSDTVHGYIRKYMYVCLYIHTYIYMSYIHTYIHIYVIHTYIHTYIYIYVCL